MGLRDVISSSLRIKLNELIPFFVEKIKMGTVILNFSDC